MDKVSQNPFSPLPSSNDPKPPHKNLPMPNDVQMAEGVSTGIKRKVEQISSDESGVNPEIVQAKLLEREGNRAKYKKGITYEGDFIDGIPNGKGVLNFKEGRTYAGNLKNGYPHGHGKMTYSDGSYYEGTFQRGLPQGSGVFRPAGGKNIETVFKDGVFTKGTIKIAFQKDGSFYYGPSGNRKGKGIYFSSKGLKFSGSIVNECFQGEGVVFKKNKLFFEGQFENNKPVKGKMQFDDGYYIGDVDANFNCVGQGRFTNKARNSVLEGIFLENGDVKGVVSFANGIKVSGYFKDWAEPVGKVEIVYPNGNIYRGMIAEGKPQGQGEIVHTDGTRFEGQFDNGSLIDGTIHYPDGTVYRGEVKDFRMHGFGKFIGINASYVGEFHEDAFRGYGTGTFPSGVVYEGLWLDGRPFAFFENSASQRSFSWIDSGTLKTNQYEGLNEGKTGFGKIIYPNGSIYKGSVIDGFANGEGQLVSPQGDVYEGAFYDGKPFGRGKILFKNYSYEGEFVNGLYSGHGKEIEKNGNNEISYKGDYVNGLRQGEGIIRFLNGLSMKVNFDEEGRLTLEKTFFIGDVSGKLGNEPVFISIDATKALIVLPEGVYLEAEIIDGKVASGVLHYTNGNTYSGQFLKANDNPTSFFPEGIGTMTIKGFGVFKGSFKDGFPDIPSDYLLPFTDDQIDFFKARKLA